MRLLHLPADAFAERRHYYLIDFFRGVAALAVIIWHYQHFWMLDVANKKTALVGPISQPFYGFLSVFYAYGLYSVQFFWVISGFVFASVYGGQKPTAMSYAVNRFSRLYPLHFVTLVVVAVLQWTSCHYLGSPQLVAINDPYHFALHLGFMSYWGFEAGDSFNQPVWSVSVEVFIYIVFWVVLPFIFRYGLAGPAAMVLLFFSLQAAHVPGVFWGCGQFFFIGSGLFLLHKMLERNRALVLLISGGLIAVGAALFSTRQGPGIGLPIYVVLPFLFSGIVLLLSHLESSRIASVFKRMKWVGDNTYSVYLWHTPLQIAILIVLDTQGISRDIASSPLFWIAFLATVMIAGRLSFVYIERPAQSWFRNLFKRSVQTPQTAAPAQPHASPLTDLIAAHSLFERVEAEVGMDPPAPAQATA